MEKLLVGQIIEATGGKLMCGKENDSFDKFITDSRNVVYGAMFIPIKGEKYDGHDFIDGAIKSGAKGIITQKDIYWRDDCVIIKVADTKKALGDIARYYRNFMGVPLVAVTGSVGKTTTKDMIACALSQKYNVHKTNLNFNNDIGVPLTLLGLKREHNMAVVEMGMNHFGEIRYLSGIAEPDGAVITNIGMSHIENLGSKEGILKAKMEICEHMHKDAPLFLNGDDDMLWNVKTDKKKIYFGINNKDCDYTAENIENFEDKVEFDAVFGGERQHISVRLPGEHNVYNALAALAVSRYFEIDAKEAAKGIYGFETDGIRLSLCDLKDIKLIDDCYNASPASVEAAVRVLCAIKNRRHVAILGDIKELGDYAPAAHGRLGRIVVNLGIDALIAVGENSKFLYKAALDAGLEKENCLYFKHIEEAKTSLSSFVKKGDAVLVKASHSMKFEQISTELRECFDK